MGRSFHRQTSEVWSYSLLLMNHFSTKLKSLVNEVKSGMKLVFHNFSLFGSKTIFMSNLIIFVDDSIGTEK